ncbi:uncharacterized protein BDR25DRAFT_350321 [Lindgomyces ingoldianus]|uniref:Uncharacterized protein n=1 Tax=Lindgomyces ingoldianus TaxID=673940 RepID=A0ACB6RC01_9PLEO|nr:uncharacterized protein BDR25DRAFT_350321 [Lindgomyces ingoldianus]KAF2476052.1 hypothetical protein BDR25DRAFT_350321 [Lindgomyces ingoldianus]
MSPGRRMMRCGEARVFIRVLEDIGLNAPSSSGGPAAEDGAATKGSKPLLRPTSIPKAAELVRAPLMRRGLEKQQATTRNRDGSARCGDGAGRCKEARHQFEMKHAAWRRAERLRGTTTRLGRFALEPAQRAAPANHSTLMHEGPFFKPRMLSRGVSGGEMRLHTNWHAAEARRRCDTRKVSARGLVKDRTQRAFPVYNSCWYYDHAMRRSRHYIEGIDHDETSSGQTERRSADEPVFLEPAQLISVLHCCTLHVQHKLTSSPHATRLPPTVARQRLKSGSVGRNPSCLDCCPYSAHDHSPIMQGTWPLTSENDALTELLTLARLAVTGSYVAEPRRCFSDCSRWSFETPCFPHAVTVLFQKHRRINVPAVWWSPSDSDANHPLLSCDPLDFRYLPEFLSNNEEKRRLGTELPSSIYLAPNTTYVIYLMAHLPTPNLRYETQTVEATTRLYGSLPNGAAEIDHRVSGSNSIKVNDLGTHTRQQFPLHSIVSRGTECTGTKCIFIAKGSTTQWRRAFDIRNGHLVGPRNHAMIPKLGKRWMRFEGRQQTIQALPKNALLQIAKHPNRLNLIHSPPLSELRATTLIIRLVLRCLLCIYDSDYRAQLYDLSLFQGSPLGSIPRLLTAAADHASVIPSVQRPSGVLKRMILMQTGLAER